jgi:hemerythrin-like domain-containing protein
VKRHPALVPLSHDHRQGLFLAQILRPGLPRYQGVPTTPSAKRTYALKWYTELLQPHIRAEETLLAPLVTGLHHDIDQLLEHLQEEHILLHQHAQSLSQVAEDQLEAALDSFGQLLESHIRTEERQLFQCIQAVADDALMAQLAQHIANYRRSTCLAPFVSNQ